MSLLFGVVRCRLGSSRWVDDIQNGKSRVGKQKARCEHLQLPGANGAEHLTLHLDSACRFQTAREVPSTCSHCCTILVNAATGVDGVRRHERRPNRLPASSLAATTTVIDCTVRRHACCPLAVHPIYHGWWFSFRRLLLCKRLAWPVLACRCTLTYEFSRPITTCLE